MHLGDEVFDRFFFLCSLEDFELSSMLSLNLLCLLSLNHESFDMCMLYLFQCGSLKNPVMVWLVSIV